MSNALEIVVNVDGSVRVSIGGVVIGLIDELRLEVLGNLRPKVKIAFISTKNVSDVEMKSRIVEFLDHYREALHEHPFVEIFDAADTLPSMLAVRPSDKPDDKKDPESGP